MCLGAVSRDCRWYDVFRCCVWLVSHLTSAVTKSVVLSSIFGQKVTSLVCGHEMLLSVTPTSKSGNFVLYFIYFYLHYITICLSVLTAILGGTWVSRYQNVSILDVIGAQGDGAQLAVYSVCCNLTIDFNRRNKLLRYFSLRCISVMMGFTLLPLHWEHRANRTSSSHQCNGWW